MDEIETIIQTEEGGRVVICEWDNGGAWLKLSANRARMLRAHEILWNDMWEAQPNPFIKIKDYTSNEQRAMRALVINPWIEASKEYEAALKARKKK